MKRILALITAVTLLFGISAAADSSFSDAENGKYFEIYDFSEDVNGTKLTTAATAPEGVKSGFILHNSGNTASVYNVNGESYIKYKAVQDNSGAYRVAKNFVNSYTGNGVVLSFKIKSFESGRKNIRVMSGSTDLSFALNPAADNYLITGVENGTSYLKNKFNFYDGKWHEFKLVFKLEDKIANLYFDGELQKTTTSESGDLKLKSTFTSVDQFGMSATYKDSGFFLDDVLITNDEDYLPSAVKINTRTDGSATLSVRDGESAVYAVGASPEEAITALKNGGTPYAAAICLEDSAPYIAARTMKNGNSGSIEVSHRLYYEMYDFSDEPDVSEFSSTYFITLGKENTRGSGFGLINTGSSPACIKNNGVDSYIDGTELARGGLSHRLGHVIDTEKYADNLYVGFLYKSSDTRNKTIIFRENNNLITLTLNASGSSTFLGGTVNLSKAVDLGEIAWNNGAENRFDFAFLYGQRRIHIYFNGELVGNTTMNSAFSTVRQLEFGDAAQDGEFKLDDVCFASSNENIPSAAEYSQTEDGTISFAAQAGETVKYAYEMTAEDAKAQMKSAPAAYSVTIPYTGNGYIAYYTENNISGAKSAVKICAVDDGTNESLAELTVVKHLSPWSVLTTGGTESTDSLALGVESGELTVSGTVDNTAAVYDSPSADKPGNRTTVSKDSYIDLDFSRFTGQNTVRDMKIVFGKINNNASYKYELLFRKTGEESFTRFYKSEYSDSASYTNPVYPTEVLTDFGDQVSDVKTLRIKFGADAELYEIDMNTAEDSERMSELRAEKLSKLSISKLFSSNAVIQRDEPFTVNGFGGTNYGTVTVTLTKNGSENHVQTVKAEVENYKWSADFKAVGGSLDEYTIKVTDDSDSSNYAESTNILFGEVFVAAGQSNMEMTLRNTVNNLITLNTEESLAEAARIQSAADSDSYTAVRILNQSNMITSLMPLDEAYTASWADCGSYETAQNSSAVAYFFAKSLYEKLGKSIPVGVMLARRGGTKIKAWMPEDYFNTETYGKNLSDNYRSNYFSFRVWTGGYNALVAPLTKAKINGVIWYQGEDDTDIVQGYKQQFADLVRGWRAKFGKDDLSFNVVQLSAYGNSPNKWADFRQTQLQLWQKDDRNTMITTIDIGEKEDIHPAYKAPVGERLARAAAAKLYGSTEEYSGPLFDSVRKEGSSLIVKFTHADGMAARTRTPYSEYFTDAAALNGFEISADGTEWTDAAAVISGNEVILSGVENPMYVRYAWANYPENTPNLYNSDNLPAVPFTAGISAAAASPDIKSDGNTVTVSGNTVETRMLRNTAKAVIARYVNGALKNVEIKDIPTVINEQADFSFSVPSDGAEKIGVTILDSLTALRPLNKSAFYEISAQ